MTTSANVRIHFAPLVPDVALDAAKIATHYFWHEWGRLNLVVLTTDGGYSLPTTIGIDGTINSGVIRVCNNCMSPSEELEPHIKPIADKARADFLAGKRIFTGATIKELK